ncbi:DEAD-domain-containing protein, partial [Cyathus striatus]
MPSLSLSAERLRSLAAMSTDASQLVTAGKKIEKTTAKKRYLKRKKDRRKHRPKQSANVEIGPDNTLQDDATSYSSEDSELPDVVSTTGPEHRHTKRRKVESIEQERPATPSQPSTSFIDEKPVADEIRSSTARPESPITVLPSFPLPEAPNPPSKTDLALQGLDKAIIDADIVDPGTTLIIPESGDDDGGTRLSEKMRRRLKDLGITELFAVQTSLLPFLLPEEPLSRALYQPYSPPRDVCVSAPTGSGKTLAYVLPIIEILSTRIVTRLRALVILPTRDLVNQVREAFEALNKGRGLKIGTATGQHSFAHEQSQLVQDKSTELQGGSSKVDILICTPGRLIDHLNGTPNFSLQHLRFLVVDEADRLLTQSFQDWLAQVSSATRASKSATKMSCNPTDSIELYPDAVAPVFLHDLRYPDVPVFFTEERVSSCQKLLFSATLTRDPGKIAALDLRDPKYFMVQGSSNDVSRPHILNVAMEKFAVPDTLKEHLVVCEPSQKPLIFFHLVHSSQVKNALVFTKSAESTARLVHLFQYFERARTEDGKTQPLVVMSYSSDLPPSERKSILDKFKAQEIHLLVCSDLISRGIDISHVSHVVSYDAPVDMRKYVHRVGRTARAGRTGDAWTLVEEQEARYFKNMLKQADHLDALKRVRVLDKDTAPLLPFYEIALQNLKGLYTRSG